MNGRGERIRTSDLSVPNRAHYQAVLRPEIEETVFSAGQAFYEAEMAGSSLPASRINKSRQANNARAR